MAYCRRAINFGLAEVAIAAFPFPGPLAHPIVSDRRRHPYDAQSDIGAKLKRQACLERPHAAKPSSVVAVPARNGCGSKLLLSRIDEA